MAFWLNRLFVASLFAIFILSFSGCGSELQMENTETPEVFGGGQAAQQTSETIPVQLVSVLEGSTQGTRNKPYQIAIVKLTITQIGGTGQQILNSTPDASGKISVVASLEVGSEYEILALAYENANASGPVRYRGTLQTGILTPDSSSIIIRLKPAAPGSTFAITNTYVTNITSTGGTLMADITPSSNVTLAYFEWRTAAETAFSQAQIISLGSSEVPTSISQDLASLVPNTTYFFRAVVTNNDATEYGPEVRFATRLNNATLSWSPPLTNEDGTSLNDLMGYKVYHRKPSGITSTYDILKTTPQQDTTTVQYTMEGLSTGTHFFSVTALDFNGNESAPTPEVSKTIN
ncbi:MAG: hypothetical protein ACE5FU_10805 [Nitrospinota bacterium]